MTDTVEKFLNRILKACEGKRYLFRGTTQSHSKKRAYKINSSLYRWARKGEDEINSSLYRWARNEDIPFDEDYSPFDIEKEILERAKRLYSKSAKNIEVLTDLQHFQGKTNLIDFSHSLYIALFFACYGDEEHHEEDGELILLDSAKIEEKPDVVYEDLKLSPVPFSIEPANTQFSQKRVTFQSSVFVYPPSGYINRDLCEIIPVPAKLKQPVLDHLREIHNIHTDTIYNDPIGFITNEKNYETASVLFYRGFASDSKGKYKEAIDYYDRAIELNLNNAGAYNNRGVAKKELGQYQEAIGDYDKAIELNPGFVEAYNNRGNAKNKLGQHQQAIDDFNRVVELDPNYAIAYNNRGIAKNNLEQHQVAIIDFNKAIELNPDFVEAYNNRGVAKSNLEQHQEAIADYDKTIELDPNYAIAYNNRGFTENNLRQYQEAIADFNKAIELDPNYATAYINRGFAKRALGRNQEAIEDFEIAAKFKRQ